MVRPSNIEAIMEANEAREALGAVQGAQTRLAAAASCPPWRHYAFGAIMAALVVQVALPFALKTVMLVWALVSIALIARHDRRRTGLFVNGWRRGPTLPISIALFACLIGLMAWSSSVRWLHAPAWNAALAGAVAFVLAVGASRLWQRVYVNSLRRELAA